MRAHDWTAAPQVYSAAQIPQRSLVVFGKSGKRAADTYGSSDILSHWAFATLEEPQEIEEVIWSLNS